MSLETQVPQTIAADAISIYERGKVDINFFAALALPNVCTTPFPDLYVLAWQLITSSEGNRNKELFRFALGLPRGFAKTTFIKVVIAWMVCYDFLQFVLVVCANDTLAENLLADLNDILDSDNMRSIYGKWEETLSEDNKGQKKAHYHGRDILLVARGWSSGIRGINLKNRRPDFIFCDDAQTKENDESPTERAKLLNTLASTIFKAISYIGRRTIVYVGNLYSDECILQQFRKNKHWTSLVTGAILADGESLWPEMRPIESLKEDYEHDEALGLAHVWFAEVMNDPRSILHSLLPKPVPPSDILGDFEDDGAFITIDPAGYRKHSDDNVIVLHRKFNDIPYAQRAIRGVMDPATLIRDALTMAIDAEVSLIGVESVAYQQTLKFWLEFFIQELRLNHIEVVELKPHGRSKEARIRQFVSSLYGGTYFIHGAELRRDFTWQGSMYKIGKKDNKDDLLDAVSYGEDIRQEYWHLVKPTVQRRPVIADCRVVHNSCF